MTDFVARVAADQDCSFGHATSAAAIRRTDQMSRLAPHMDQSTVPSAADPIAGVAEHVNFAAAHLAADMPTRGAMNDDLSGLHLRSDPVNTAQVAFPLQHFIRQIATNVEELR